MSKKEVLMKTIVENDLLGSSFLYVATKLYDQGLGQMTIKEILDLTK